jgi:hypothetical protein
LCAGQFALDRLSHGGRGLGEADLGFACLGRFGPMPLRTGATAHSGRHQGQEHPRVFRFHRFPLLGFIVESTLGVQIRHPGDTRFWRADGFAARRKDRSGADNDPEFIALLDDRRKYCPK